MAAVTKLIVFFRGTKSSPNPSKVIEKAPTASSMLIVLIVRMQGWGAVPIFGFLYSLTDTDRSCHPGGQGRNCGFGFDSTHHNPKLPPDLNPATPGYTDYWPQFQETSSE